MICCDTQWMDPNGIIPNYPKLTMADSPFGLRKWWNPTGKKMARPSAPRCRISNRSKPMTRAQLQPIILAENFEPLELIIPRFLDGKSHLNQLIFGGSVSRLQINLWGQSQPVFTKLPWPLPLYPKLLVGWLTILLGFTEPSAQVSSAIGAQSLLCNRNLWLLWVVPTVLLTFWPRLLLRRQHGIPCMNHSWNNQ